jgi:hypothetical protein
MEVFWSLRMNDGHDSYPPGARRWDYGLAPFKRDHPEFLVGEPDDSDSGPWTALDYSFKEVRDHVFSIIAEVAHNYDLDGIEMDFLRHYPYFCPTRESFRSGAGQQTSVSSGIDDRRFVLYHEI